MGYFLLTVMPPGHIIKIFMEPGSSDVTRKRRIDVSIEIEAPRERVWAALTDPGEIPRWLAPSASVHPGMGGFVELSWGEGMTSRNIIEVWDPPDRLTLLSENGELREEYTLSDTGGGTRLTLCHSGFPAAPERDAEYNAISNGWQAFFKICSHVFRGGATRPYRNVTVFSVVPAPRDAVWSALAVPGGLSAEGLREYKAGEQARLSLAAGQTIEGPVVHCAWPGYLAILARNLDDSIFAIFCERADEGSFLTITWILTGAAVASADPIRKNWTAWMDAAAGMEEAVPTGSRK